MKRLFLLTFFLDTGFLSPPHSQYPAYHKNYSAQRSAFYHHGYFLNYGNQGPYDPADYEFENTPRKYEKPYPFQNHEPNRGSYNPSDYDYENYPSQDERSDTFQRDESKIKFENPTTHRVQNSQSKERKTYSSQNNEPNREFTSSNENSSRKDARSHDIQNDRPSTVSDIQLEPRLDAIAAPTRRNKQEDTIVYPGAHTTVTRRDANITGYNCNFDLCEDAVDYPGDHIKNLFRNNRAFDAFFNATLPDLGSKGPFGYENLCRSVINTTFPKTAVNMKKKKRYIANEDQYQQGVKVETCRGDQQPCRFSNLLPLGYQTICEQKFVVTPLIALDDDMRPVVDTFLTPSCCVCMYREQ